MAIRRLGQIMVEMGFITPEQVESVLREQERHRGELFGRLAVQLHLITDEQLAQALGKQLRMQVVNLAEIKLNQEVLGQVTEPMAQLYRVIPIDFRDNTLTVATCDPQKLSVVDELRSFLGYNVRAVVATEKDVLKALDKYYAAGGESVEPLLAEMEADAELSAAMRATATDGPIDLAGVEALADSAPVRKLMNIILLQAIRDRASDIHFEP